MSQPLSTLARSTEPATAQPDHLRRDTILASVVVAVVAVVVTFSQPTAATALGPGCDPTASAAQTGCVTATR